MLQMENTGIENDEAGEHQFNKIKSINCTSYAQHPLQSGISKSH